MPQSFTPTSSSFSHRRITEWKGGIVSISAFKPVLTRIPRGSGAGMTPDAYLMLDVDHIEPLGSEGELEFGRPQPLETHADLWTWTLALRKHGGEG
jgi:hypothetical protein